jgi:hypothetical protein
MATVADKKGQARPWPWTGGSFPQDGPAKWFNLTLVNRLINNRSVARFGTEPAIWKHGRTDEIGGLY